MWRVTICVFVLCNLKSSVFGQLLPDDDTVDLVQGTLRGSSRILDGRRVYYFLGVPYAEPPLSNRRFRPSSPHNGWTVNYHFWYIYICLKCSLFNKLYLHVLKITFNIFCSNWKGTYIARDFKPVCPQPTGNAVIRDQMSEDCLYLNVFAPSKIHPTKKYPVLFWIHGGCYVEGTPNIFNGTA